MSNQPRTRKQRIVEAFGKAAEYDAFSGLQQEIAEDLWQEIAAHLPKPPKTVFEIGCGTGHLTRKLCENLPKATIHSTDASSAMVERCRAKNSQHHREISFGIFDGEVPGPLESWNLVCSSMTFQWFPKLETVLAQYRRNMQEGSHLAISLPGHGSLREWKEFAELHELPVGIPEFVETPRLVEWLKKSGFSLVCLSEKTHLRTFENALEFLRSIRGTGAVVPASHYVQHSAARLRAAVNRQTGEPFRCTWNIIHAIAKSDRE